MTTPEPTSLTPTNTGDCSTSAGACETRPYDPHPGVECCPCVERLRSQNKASSDEWTKRTADMTSDLNGLKNLMREAADLHRRHLVIGTQGLSRYGQAALAEALRIADEAEANIEAFRSMMHRERRARLYAEEQLRQMRAKNSGRIRDDG